MNGRPANPQDGSAPRLVDRPEPTRAGEQLAAVLAQMSDPPSLPVAEQGLLGAVMRWPKVADQVLPFTYDHYFHTGVHQQIFTSTQGLWCRRQPTTPTAVLADLHARSIRQAGARDIALLLDDCLQAAWTEQDGPHCLALLTEYAARRRAVEAGVRIVQMAQPGHGDLPTLMKRIGAEYGRIRTEANRHERAQSLTRTPARPPATPAEGRTAATNEVIAPERPERAGRDAAPEDPDDPETAPTAALDRAAHPPDPALLRVRPTASREDDRAELSR